MNKHQIETQYQAAREQYAELGVDTEAVLRQLEQLEISMHCWQGDDVTGLEQMAGGTSGGIMSTGSSPGIARDGDELRDDMAMALSLLPGRHRVNLHASYAETGSDQVDRDSYEMRHFEAWLNWARQHQLAVDFNPTLFGHRLADDNMTLTHPDESTRQFWIRHCQASRRIADGFGRALGRPSICNIWIPDGSKDIPADRGVLRRRLKDSLDAILSEALPGEHLVDAIESKLFGVGVESFTAGSHEFYMGYLAHSHALGRRNVVLTLDMGHYHPTEAVSDKISALLTFYPRLLVHVSRPVKWDSDHVVITDDALQDLMREIHRSDAFDRVSLATDFFDGSINRIAAWVIGLRATRRAALQAMLEPTERIREAEAAGHLADRLALTEEAKHLPAQAVWNEFCVREQVPAGLDYLEPIHEYERRILRERS